MAQKFCWHYISLYIKKILQLSNCRRHSNTNGLEDLAADASTLAAHGNSLAILFYGRFLKRPQILLDVIPLEFMSCDIQSTLQLFAQNQSQETAKIDR